MKLLFAALLALAPASALQDAQAPAPESLLARPLYLGEDPPPLRALDHIVLLHADVSRELVPHDVTRSLEETLVLAKELVETLRGGADFAELAREHSAAVDARTGASLGAWPRGILLDALDAFLWSAELGEISDPIETPLGVQVLRRSAARAGVLQIQLRGDDAEARAHELVARLRDGADFAELAREHSVDEASRERGGRYAIFVRGSRDTQLKAAAFELAVGETSEPVPTPLGWHVLRRVPPEELAPELEERTFVRARGILIAWKGCFGAPDDVTRDKARAQELVLDMQARIRGGDPFETYAGGRFNDDPGGRARAGDLGWIYRRNPDLPVFMDELFRVPAGTVLDLTETTAGYVLLLREE